MSWIEISSYIFFAFLLTTFTGTVFYALWGMFRLIMGRGYEKLMNTCLRVCLQTYTFPVLFIGVMIRHGDDFFQLSEDGLVTRRLIALSPVMQVIVTVGVSIWLLCIAGVIIYWLIQTVKMVNTMAGSVPEDDDGVLACYEGVKASLGIEKDIPLVRNDMIGIPFTTGVFRHKVVLPFIRYNEKELRIIFAHELTHCMRHDLFFKLETIFVNVLNAVNPLVYMLHGSLTKYAENTCDACACERAAGLFSDKEYFNILTELASDRKREPLLILAALAEKKSDIEKRVRVAEAYRKRGNLKKSSACGAVVTFVTAGAAASYLAGVGLVKLQSNLYEATREVSKFKNESGKEDGGGEYVIPAKEASDNIAFVEDGTAVDENGILGLEWCILVGRKNQTTPFHLYSGTKVVVQVALEPVDKMVRVGLEYPDGSLHYIEGMKNVNYVFSVPSEGEYRFFVENVSDAEVDMYGGYIY